MTERRSQPEHSVCVIGHMVTKETAKPMLEVAVPLYGVSTGEVRIVSPSPAMTLTGTATLVFM
jgi:hypothetical protein